MKTQKNDWAVAISISVAFNIIALVASGYYWLMYKPEPPVTDDIVEVTISSEPPPKLGGKPAGPDIAAPKKSEVPIPPPPTPQEAESVTKAPTPTPAEAAPIQTQAPVQTAAPSSSSSSSSDSSAGNTGTGGGAGQGDGAAEGSDNGVAGGQGVDLNATYEEGSLVVASRVRPVHPPQLLRKNIEGVVGLSIVVEPDGTVSGASVVSSSGYPAMDRAALDAIYQWTFVPATRNGINVRARANQSIRFNLD